MLLFYATSSSKQLSVELNWKSKNSNGLLRNQHNHCTIEYSNVENLPAKLFAYFAGLLRYTVLIE